MTTWTGYTNSDDDCLPPSSSVLVERMGQKCIWQVSGVDSDEVAAWEAIFLDEDNEDISSTLLDQNKQEYAEDIMPMFCERNSFQGDNCFEWAKTNFITADSIKINLCGQYSEWDDVPTECKCMRRDLNPANIKLQQAGAYIGSPACVDVYCMGDDGDPQLIPSSLWAENIDCTGLVCQNILSEGAIHLDADEEQDIACGFGSQPPPPPPEPGLSPSFSDGASGGASGGASVGFSNVDLFAMVLDRQTYYLIVGFIAIFVPLVGSLLVGRKGLISLPFLLVYGSIISGLLSLGVLRARTSVFEDN